MLTHENLDLNNTYWTAVMKEYHMCTKALKYHKEVLPQLQIL